MSRPPLPKRPDRKDVEIAVRRANLRPTETKERKIREFKRHALNPIRDPRLNSLEYRLKDLDINFYDTDQIENEIIMPIRRNDRQC